MIRGALLQLATFTSDLVLWGAGLLGITGGGGGAIAYIKRIDSRSKRNKRKLDGDPNDPNHEGVLQIAYDARETVHRVEEDVERLERKMDSQHEQVIQAVAEATDVEIDPTDDD